MNVPVHNTRKVMDTIVQAVATVLLGKEDQIRLALACLLARGHLLIEDLPGMGKTTLAQGLARALGLSFSRIQSALLEAMAERQATVEGETRPLPRPFFVIATQNPVTQAGTFPLPESQQDRFTACLSLGYPDPAAERRLLEGGDPRRLLDRISPCLSAEQLQHFQHAVSRITASEAIIDYLQRLIQYTRTQGEFEHGLSPRAGLALLQCARAWAMIAGRHYVVPEDVQAVFPAVAGHRLQGAGVTATVARVWPAFAGDKARVDLSLCQAGSRHRDNIVLWFAGGEPVTAALASEEARVSLHVPAPRRGRLVPGRLTIESRYPLGLFRVWTHIRPSCSGLVYPRPLPGHPIATGVPARDEGPLQAEEGAEEFRGLARYRLGDSLHRVAWKAYAQGRGMFSKQFSDPAADKLWIDWYAFPGLDREARLSRLCHWVLEAASGHAPYGLRLPGLEWPPDRGDAHRDRLLESLALHEIDPEAGS